MDAKPTELYLCDYNQSDYRMIKENILLKQLQAEAELCYNNEHTEDEVAAVIWYDNDVLSGGVLHTVYSKNPNPLFIPLPNTQYVRMVPAILYQATPFYMVGRI